MKTTGKIIFAALIILIALSCKKGDQLPKPTQTGANMMAAKINGKIWKKKACFSCIGGGSGISVYNNNNYYEIAGEENSTIISLYLVDVVSLSVSELGQKSANPVEKTNYARIEFFNTTKYYTTNFRNKGKVTITRIDKVNKIISGTFEFTAEDEKAPGNTIRVSDGWFDVKYN